MRGGPAGGGYSTVDDLFKFDVALRSGKLVGQEIVKTLLSAKPELNSPDYGYGFQIDKELSIAGHGGGFPGISSNLDMFLSNGYTAAVMSNYGFCSDSGLAKDSRTGDGRTGDAKREALSQFATRLCWGSPYELGAPY